MEIARIYINRGPTYPIWEVYTHDIGIYWKKIAVFATLQGAVDYCNENNFKYEINTA